MPPLAAASPEQRLGSISLCGGARSNCAQPQNMSRGKNMRSPESAAYWLGCELALGELVLGAALSCGSREELSDAFTGAEICAPANDISTGTVNHHAQRFIMPPRIVPILL